jgi:alkaline phosphatase/alkaline phosphatase D
MAHLKSASTQLTATLLCLASISTALAGPAVEHGQGEMAGEVTASSVILQSRLTAGSQLVDGDLPGAAGIARFEIATDKNFEHARLTDWIEATSDYDYIIKTKVTGLKPATRYYYRLRYGATRQAARPGPACSFKTLSGPEQSASTGFVVVTGMNYGFFHHGTDGRGRRMYTGPDKHLGFPALEAMLRMEPDFFVGTGDNVYYDHPRPTRARTRSELRRKWHAQFVQPRFIEFFSRVPTYWEKDDHDHRFNDCDPHSPLRGAHKTAADGANPELAQQPSSRLGIRTFWEQVPVVDPEKSDPVTYRTHRVSRELQIWLVEGRDYRSANHLPDGPGKTVWGEAQMAWLKRTLLESDATFKILISPTPMVGPDSAGKRDSHVNIGGFQHEAGEFVSWLAEHEFLEQKFYLVCGDRHWQYHAVHPSGFEEFSCGAMCDANAFVAIKPGQKGSTDPEAKITHKYTGPQTGGFLHVAVAPQNENAPAELEFSFFDERGQLLYRESKPGR